MCRATERVLVLGCNDDNFNINANGNVNNNRPAREWPPPLAGFSHCMKTFKNLFGTLCSWDNLEDAYEKARKHKSHNPRVKEFEKHWRFHLATLSRQLRTKQYCPQHLRKFVLRDPKTRVICVSEFVDRVVHHALVNVLQPIFQPRFIHDSYASQKGKGTLRALKRFDCFVREITKNGKKTFDGQRIVGFVLKADVQHYFDTVDHAVLLDIIKKRVKDEDILWLVKVILDNYNSGSADKGMPLGNWTSQFFANIYLNELDQFVKHTLKAKYYIRYVDDFVILGRTKSQLDYFRQEINEFLKMLKLELHPNKCRMSTLERGVSFLGFRVFPQHKLVRVRNLRKIKRSLSVLLEDYEEGFVDADDVFEVLKGWNGYAMHGNTYVLRKNLEEYVRNELTIRTDKRLAKII